MIKTCVIKKVEGKGASGNSTSIIGDKSVGLNLINPKGIGRKL